MTPKTRPSFTDTLATFCPGWRVTAVASSVCLALPDTLKEWVRLSPFWVMEVRVILPFPFHSVCVESDVSLSGYLKIVPS